MRRPAQSPFGDGAVSVEVRILDESCTIGELDERVPPVYNLEHLARTELAHGASVGSVQESCTAELEGEPGGGGGGGGRYVHTRTKSGR